MIESNNKNLLKLRYFNNYNNKLRKLNNKIRLSR